NSCRMSAGSATPSISFLDSSSSLMKYPIALRRVIPFSWRPVDYRRFLTRTELMPRVLLIGWDGADWRILDPMLESGVLPNLQALIDRGAKGVQRSTIPTHSWSAWPSFLTGVDPADHGVYDILENVPGTHRQLPVTYRSIKERTILADLAAAGKRTLMINVPLTFPPPSIDGEVIAGGVLPKGRDFTYPSELASE